ncbi:HAMP domain-containing sensor histidine kinase [Desulfovibrio inopinatus]|uniref:HAMP domain-containing sensor histidine kinase n=1 Tax=Desulfovibrio inopinatus TaxID=102109 RepID=UPI0004280282|nr:HAMP domain-containing sensor histidine kinase [Desulfovibrio inopinatus]
MPRGMSFGSRLLVSFLFVVVFALLGPALFLVGIVNDHVQLDAEATAARQLHLIHRLVSQLDSSSESDPFKTLSDVAKDFGVRILYEDTSRQALFDTAHPLADTTPEPPFSPPKSAIRTEFGNNQVTTWIMPEGRDEIVVAQSKFPGIQRLEPGIMTLTMPFSSLSGPLHEVAGTLFSVIGLSLCLGLGLSYVLTRRIRNSIREMIAVVEAIGQGRRNKRLKFYPGEEFGAMAKSINTMADNIEMHLRAVIEQKIQLEAILNGMREGVMVLDRKGRIAAINKATNRIFPSIHNNEMGKKPIEVVASPDLQAACDELYNKENNPPHVLTIEIEPETDRFFDVNLVKLKESEAGLGAILVFHDLSDFRKMEKMRRDFVANVSHELRTPLTSVKGYAETLLGEADTHPPHVRRFLEIILKNANHMSKMVEDLLCLARIENEKDEPTIARINAREALAGAWRECALQAKEKDIDVTIDLPDKGVPVMADFNQVSQVFRNLIENAIKYSPAGENVTISFHIVNATVIFRIQDSGPGIPEEDRERIFERFYRVERHRTKTSGGTGLGLAIAKHIIDRHGGRIWVEPAGQNCSGAAFLFSLPTASSLPDSKGSPLDPSLQS